MQPANGVLGLDRAVAPRLAGSGPRQPDQSEAHSVRVAERQAVLAEHRFGLVVRNTLFDEAVRPESE